MPAITYPNLGLKAGFTLGENGWDDEMTANILLLSILVQGRVQAKQAALPGAPVDGDLVILDETNMANPNDLAARISGAWTYIDAQVGWRMWNIAQGYYEVYSGTKWVPQLESIIVAVGDEVTPLTAGVNKVRFPMPYGFVLKDVFATLITAQATSGAGGLVTVDLNEAGASVLSTKVTFDNGEKTSLTAAAAEVISDTALAAGAEMGVDIDVVGDGTAVGLKIVLLGVQL